MASVSVQVPDELDTLFAGTPLDGLPLGAQVRAAAAITLYQQGVVSIGKAAELAQFARIPIEKLLVRLGIPVALIDETELVHDLESLNARD